jgi:hypothetical protein
MHVVPCSFFPIIPKTIQGTITVYFIQLLSLYQAILPSSIYKIAMRFPAFFEIIVPTCGLKKLFAVWMLTIFEAQLKHRNV